MVFVLQYSLYRSVCLWRLHKNTLVPEIPGWLLATGHNSEKLLIKSRAEKKPIQLSLLCQCFHHRTQNQKLTGEIQKKNLLTHMNKGGHIFKYVSFTY